jgi:hypothetical protein
MWRTDTLAREGTKRAQGSRSKSKRGGKLAASYGHPRASRSERERGREREENTEQRGKPGVRKGGGKGGEAGSLFLFLSFGPPGMGMVLVGPVTDGIYPFILAGTWEAGW